MVTKHFTLSSALSAACLLGACVQSMNPCPQGSMARDGEDRCVQLQEIDPDVDAGGDAGPAQPDSPDATVDPGEDASMPELDATAGDGGQDGAVDDDGGEEAIDAGGDASTPDGAVSDDAGADGGSECSSADVESWKSFHLAPGLVAQILGCASDPSCADGECTLDVCVREAAGLSGCESCVAAEVDCVARECTSECGVSGDDDACRACACSSGCTEAFAACAGSSLEDVCADCGENTCQNMSVLAPELIMAVLHPVLLAPLPVMP